MTCDPQSLLDAVRCFSCIPAGMMASVGTNLLCGLVNKSREVPITCTDPQTDDWLARIDADPLAIRPPPAIINAVCVFCHDLRAAGIFNKMIVVNPIIPPTNGTPASLRAMLHPLIYEAGNTALPFTNNNFLVADLNLNGLIGDGVSKYIDTGFDPASHWLAENSGGQTVYVSEPRQAFNDPNPECELGTVDLVTGYSHILAPTFQPVAFPNFLAYCWSNPTGITIPLGSFAAFYSANRTAVDQFDAYQATSTFPCQLIGQNLNDNSGETPPDASTFFMAQNGGGPIQYSTKRVSFMAIHEGLTQVEACALYDAVQRMRMSFGGGFV